MTMRVTANLVELGLSEDSSVEVQQAFLRNLLKDLETKRSQNGVIPTLLEVEGMHFTDDPVVVSFSGRVE